MRSSGTIAPADRWITRLGGPTALLFCTTIAGCTGVLGGDGSGDPDSGFGTSGEGGDGDGDGDGDAVGPGDGDGDTPIDRIPPPECPTEEPYVGTSVIRRLTNHQYDRTALLLFGDNSNPGKNFPAETREEGYDNQAGSQHIQQPQVISWERAATELAERAAADLDGLLACDTSTEGVDSCLSAGLPGLLQRLLRAAPDPETVARYQAFYDELRAETDGARATELLVRAMLLAPQFLFLIEEGTADENGTYRLNGFEVAARLSFLLWNQAPDEALLAAAGSGLLDTKEGVAAEARRMLADDRALDTIRDFHGQWIHVSEVDNMVLPEGADESLKDAARHELESFVTDWYATGSGTIDELFTSRSAYVDEQLADYYGATAPAGGQGVVELPEGQRAGLLTRAVFLGTHVIPPTRGDFVLARVLCSPVPPLTIMPPAAPDLGENATTRERFERHSEDPCAKGCHGVIDPVGFAFEHYSNTGVWRQTENGQPIDSATVLTLSEESGVNGPVSDAIELSDKIAHSSLTADCLGENWFRYANGRPAVAQDDCSVQAMQSELRGSGDVRELLVQLTQTDAFLYIRKEGL